jgi:hypothetical protein
MSTPATPDFRFQEAVRFPTMPAAQPVGLNNAPLTPPPPPPPAPPPVGVATGKPSTDTVVADKSYIFELNLIDNLPDGTSRNMRRAQMMLVAGKPASIHLGRQLALYDGTVQDLVSPVVVGSKNGASLVSLGVQLQVKVVKLAKGYARVDLTLERNDVDTASKDGIVIKGDSLRVVRKVQLGKPVTLVLDKNDQDPARTRIEFKVTEATSR